MRFNVSLANTAGRLAGQIHRFNGTGNSTDEGVSAAGGFAAFHKYADNGNITNAQFYNPQIDLSRSHNHHHWNFGYDGLNRLTGADYGIAASDSSSFFDFSGMSYDKVGNITDHLGSTRAVADDTGTVLEAFDYYPFGLLMPKRNTASANTTEKFSGKELDENTNQYYFGARYLDPALGRFFVPDRFADKYPSLTPYQYAANNPMGFVDVNGDTLVDDNGNVVGVTINEDEAGNFSTSFTFAEGTSQEIKDAFHENAGRVVSAMSLTKEGRKQISNLNSAEHGIHVNISSQRKIIRDNNGNPIAIRTGGTQITDFKVNSDGLTITPKRVEITIYEGSINLIANQPKQLSGILGGQQKLGIVGMLGATGTHESVHATSLLNINQVYSNQTRGTNINVELAPELAEAYYMTQFFINRK